MGGADSGQRVNIRVVATNTVVILRTRFARLEGWAATTVLILRGSQALAPQDDDRHTECFQ